MPSQPRPDTNRRVLLVGAFVTTLMLSACNPARLISPPQKPATVSLQGYLLDLKFGTPPAPRVNRPHTDQPPVQGPVGTQVEPYQPPDYGPPPSYPPIDNPPPVEPACPPPGPNTGADRQITRDLTDAVQAGRYHFEQSGSITIAGLATIKVDGATRRTVTSVTHNADGSTDWVEDETIGALRHQVVGYHAVPGQGVYLASLKVTYGGQTNTFSPVLPVKVLPLPVTSPLPTIPTQAEQPLQFGDVGVDPLNNATMVTQGTVSLSPERVNGCGEAADGWHVDATWSIRFGATQQTYQLSYTVAPQYGGFIIADHIKTTDTFNGVVMTVDVATRFGSLHPAAVSAAS